MPTEEDKGFFDFDEKWDYSNPEATGKSFRELLKDSPDDEYRFVLLTQIARSEGLQQKFDEAWATLESIDDLESQSAVVQIRYYLEKGRLLNSSGKPKEAIPLFERALQIGTKNNLDFFAVDAAHMLGIVSSGEKALEWNLRAQSLAEESSSDRARKWLGPLYNNIGWTYHDEGDFENALRQFEKALQFHQAIDPRSNSTNIARWTVGRVKRSLGHHVEALSLQRNLLADLKIEGKEDGFVYEEIAECLLELENQEEAAPWFAKAYNELSKDKWLVKEEPDRVARLKKLAETVK